jgi:hypothetical protein
MVFGQAWAGNEESWNNMLTGEFQKELEHEEQHKPAVGTIFGEPCFRLSARHIRDDLNRGIEHASAA